MYKKIINITSQLIKNTISEQKLNSIQETLIKINFYVKIEELVIIIVLISLILSTITFIISWILNISKLSCIIAFFIPTILIINYIIYKNEKIKDKIESELPQYLNQLSSLLKVGLGLESALYEISQNTKGYLNNEIKRALTEIRFGKPFNESLLNIAKRNKSENLHHTFEIIIHSKESGANLADILVMISEDLTENIILKRERRASIMMSVMFLLISSIIAIPFSFSMISLYAEFIQHAGRTNPLIGIMPIVSIGYIIIHSILISFLLSIVMYSNYKKALQFSLIIIPTSLGIYYISGIFFKTVLLGGLI